VGYLHVGDAVQPLRSIQLSTRYTHDGTRVFRDVERPPEGSKAPQQLVLHFDAPALGSNPATVRHTLVGNVLTSLVRTLLFTTLRILVDTRAYYLADFALFCVATSPPHGGSTNDGHPGPDRIHARWRRRRARSQQLHRHPSRSIALVNLMHVRCIIFAAIGCRMLPLYQCSIVRLLRVFAVQCMVVWLRYMGKGGRVGSG